MSQSSLTSGEFDPIPAKFYDPVRGEVNRRPTITGWTLKFGPDGRHVRVMSGMTREAIIQQRQDVTGIQIFRVRRYDDTETLSPESGMVWRGRKYSITGVGYPNLSEIEIYTVPTTINFT